MPNKLSMLLGGDWRMVQALNELYKMTRDDSDIRLLADVLAKAHTIIRQLGLDPQDALAEEVYQALLASVPDGRAAQLLDQSDFVLFDAQGYVISFHLVDAIENYHHQLPLGRHTTKHGKRGLGFEIMRRYCQHPRTRDTAVKQVVCDGGICWQEPRPAPLAKAAASGTKPSRPPAHTVSTTTPAAPAAKRASRTSAASTKAKPAKRVPKARKT